MPKQLASVSRCSAWWTQVARLISYLEESEDLQSPVCICVFSSRPATGSCQRVSHAPASRLGDRILGGSGGRYNNWLLYLTTGESWSLTVNQVRWWRGEQMTPQKMKLHHSLFLAAAICGFGIEPLSYPCEMWLGVPPGPKEDGTKKKFTPFSTLQCSHQPVDTLR